VQSEAPPRIAERGNELRVSTDLNRTRIMIALTAAGVANEHVLTDSIPDHVRISSIREGSNSAMPLDGSAHVRDTILLVGTHVLARK